MPLDDEDVQHLLAYDNLAKQGVAGVAEQVLGSPQAPDALKWVPNGAFGLYSLLDKANTLANDALNKYVGTSIPEGHLPGAQAAGDIYMGGVDKTNDMLGVKDPQTWQESLARVIPAAVLPTPGKLETAATAADKVAKNIGDLLLPFNQSRSATQAVLGTAIPTGISEYVHQDDPDYIGLTNGTTAATPVDHMTAIDAALGGQAGKQADPMFHIDAALTAPADPMAAIDGQMKALDDNAWSFKDKALAAGAATAVGLVLGGGLAAYRSSIRAAAMQTTALSGVKQLPDDISATAKVNGALFDHAAPIYDAVKQTDPDALNPFRAKYATSVAPASIADKVNDIASTGLWPNGQRGPKLGVILQSLADLGADKTKMYDDIMRAADKQEQMLNENVNVWGNSGTRVETYGSLDGWRQQKAANPDVAKLVDDTKAFFDNARQYMLDRGVISQAEFTRMASERSNYVPDFLNRSDDSLLTQWLMPHQQGGTIESEAAPLKQRQTLQEGVMPGEGLTPSQSLPQYIHQVVSFAERNSARRDLMDILDGTSFVKKTDAAGKNVVPIFRNGEQEFYRVEDNSLWAAMTHNPTLAPLILNSTRRLFTELTTGSLNPIFMGVNAAYEGLTSALTRKQGRGTGLLSEGLNKLGTSTGTVDNINKLLPVDPTTLIAPLTGAVRGIAADTARRASIMFESSLNTGGTVSSILGKSLTSQLADIMGRAYENSALHFARSEGAGNAPMLEHWASGLHVADPTQYAPSFVRMVNTDKAGSAASLPIIRNYLALTSMIHNGMRLQHVASNMRDDMSAADRTSLAYDTRTLTGDIGTHGAAPSVQVLNQSMPWLNVTMQTGKALVNRMLEDPVAFSGRLAAISTAGLAYMVSQMVDNPVAVQKYWNEWTPEQRGRSLPYFGADGEVKHEFPLIQEYRLAWSPLIEAVGTLTGMKAEHEVPKAMSEVSLKALHNMLNGDVWTQQAMSDLHTGEKAAGAAAMPALMPPVIGAGLGAAGIDPGSLDAFSRGNALNNLKPERITGEKTDAIADRWIAQNWEKMITELTGSVGQSVINGIDAWARTNKAGYDPKDQFKAAAEQFTLHAKDQSTVVGGPALWDWDKIIPAQDSNAKLVEAKMSTLRQLKADFDQSANDQMQGRTNRPGIDAYSLYVPDDLKGTKLGAIANASNATMRTMGTNFLPQIQSMYKDMDGIRAAPSTQTDAMTQRRLLNDKAEEIRAKYAQAFTFMRDQETLLGQQFGIPNFRFDDLDMKKLKQQPSQ